MNNSDPLSRLEQQLNFILEIDRLKTVLRQSLHLTDQKQENDAEHCWTTAMMAVVLAEHAEESVDISRVVKMLLIHDIVEIDAGDLFAYDDPGKKKAQREREYKAAHRIFGLLPEEQGEELKALWTEFEKGESRDAAFANSLDRLSPLMLNYATEGKKWKEHSVTKDRALERNRSIRKGSETLWAHAKGIIASAAKKGYLRE